MLLPLDDLFIYPPWRSHAAEFGVGVPNNHLIADTILQNYSWKSLAAVTYATGQFPLWNPYILAGQPFLAAGQNASLYPPGVLYYLLPFGQAYAWFVALHLALGGVLTYWLARVLGASRFGSLVAGTTFAFCGYLVVSVLWPMVVSTAVWLPGVLAVVELVLRRYAVNDGRPRERGTVPLVLLGAGMVAMQFLAGHLEMSLYLLLTAGLYAGLRLAGQWVGWPASASGADASTHRGTQPAGRRSSMLGGPLLPAVILFGMVLLGTLGAAIQLLPFAEAISANVRVGQVSFEDVRRYALPREHLAAFVAPDFFGNPSHHTVFDLFSGQPRALDHPLSEAQEARLGTEWGSKNYVEGAAYVGILPLLLAAVALLRRRDGPTWALAAMAALSLLLAFGTPLYGLLFFGLPGVSQLHTPFRWVYPFSLCVAVLAGLGASALTRQSPLFPPRVETERGRPSLLVAWCATALGALGTLASLAAWLAREGLVGLAERALRGSGPLRQAFPDARALYSYEWSNLFGLSLLLFASGLVLLALARRAPGARVLALGLLVGDLFSFGIGFNTTADPAPLSFIPPEIQAIKADGGLFRIATLGKDDTLPANTNMLFGLQDIRGYDTIILRDYVDYLELIEPQRGLLFSKVSKLFDPASLDSPLLDLLNVKYVLTTLRVDSPGWQLVYPGEVRVYENQRVLPRAFLVAEALGAGSPDEALRLLARPDFDPRREVILEGSGAVLPAERSVTGQSGAGAASGAPTEEVGPAPRVIYYEPNFVKLEATTSRPGYLVLADVNFPGWTVSVDGVEQPLLRANRIFRAVRLPPGEHRVSFEYKPLSFRLGGLLSLLAVSLSALALGAWAYARFALGRVEAVGPVGRVVKNAIFPLTTGLLNRGLDFLFALVYLRLLGPAGAGAYTFAVVVVGWFDILVNFGLGTLLTREVARGPAETERYFSNTLATRLGLALLALLAALGLVGPLSGPLQISPEIGLAIVLFTLGMVPGALSSTASALFQARERMEVPAAVTVLATLARIGLGTGVLLAGWGVVGLAAVSLVLNLLNAAVLGGLVAGLLGWPRLRFDLAFSRGLLALSWPLMLNNLLNSLFFRIDAFLLKPLAGEAALGYYSTAYRFIDGLQIIPSTFVLALFPILSRQAAGDREALARVFALGLKVLLVLALPIAVGTTLLAEPLVELLGGPAYLPESAWALQVLIWFLPFGFVNGLTQYVLIALNRQRWITLSFFVGAAANFALNLWLIPQFSFLGAAAVTVVSEWVLLVPFWHVIRRELPPVPLLALAWRPGVASAVMGLAVYWARDISPWLAVPIGAAVYGAALLALGTVSREELKLLRRS